MQITGNLKVTLDSTTFELHGKERMCEECHDLFKDGDEVVGFVESVYEKDSTIKLGDKVYFVHLKGKENGSCFEDFVARFMLNKGLKMNNQSMEKKDEQVVVQQ